MRGRRAPLRMAQVRQTSPRIVAGLMTGTSMDGLDMALVRLEAGEPRAFELLASDVAPMPDELRQALRPQGELVLAQAMRLDQALGRWFADALEAFVDRCGITPQLIGSHGQTVFHEHGVTTCQLGEPAWAAARLGCPVVSDFRRNDIVLGGCGAPLVPIVDRWLLGDPSRMVVAVNIGGIANLTAVPATEHGQNAPVTGFDTGPGNMVLDSLARGLTQGRLTCDLDGELAARGRVDERLLAQLLEEPFFARPPPRSAGREDFGEAFTARLVAAKAPRGEQDWLDLLATAVELTIRPLAGAIRDLVPASGPPARVLVSGGGADNPFLMDRLQDELRPLTVERMEAGGISSAFKEAIAFALLASARIDEVLVDLRSITGSSESQLLGKITEC